MMEENTKISDIEKEKSLSKCKDKETLSSNWERIPEELKKRIQWVLWKLELREKEGKPTKKDGKPSKVLYSPNYHGRAKSNDPKTWGSFDKTVKVCHRFPDEYQGIGFVFTAEDPFIGIDWDDVRNPVTGEFAPGIWEEITSLNSYAEVSQSGTGAHVICKGNMPGPEKGIMSESREMYHSVHFFAVTGNHIEGTPLTINEAPEWARNSIYDKIASDKKTKNTVKEQKQPVLKDLHRTDEEIIHLCENSANGEKFKELFYKGNWQGHYQSQSEADLALCRLIAFHTRDPDQINRIFRKSGLYRDKWDSNNGSYRTKTIEKALSSVGDVRGKLEVSKQETVLREPYIITKDRIYLNVMDKNGHHMFAYLENNQIEYASCVTVDGRVVYPQELPLSRNGKTLTTVGIPLKELIESSRTLSAEELFERIKVHVRKYVDAPEQEIELFTLYILYTWFYPKLNTAPYLRFIGDTGKGKTRMLRVTSDICFYPITAGGGSTSSGIMRLNEQWHGTLRIDESDIKGGLENEFIKYLNLGFEKGNHFIKTNSADFNKQDIFDPFGPKVIAMRKPFQDNATEGRLLSFSPRETTRKDIPIILPTAYDAEVEKIRALIAKFVICNWSAVEEGKILEFNDMDLEPRLKQLAIPVSIVLQLMPDAEERFRNYLLCRQEEVTKTRSESWEGMLFNYVYSLAIGDEEPVEEYKGYVVEGKIVAITASMVAKKFNIGTKSVFDALSSIGMRSEQDTRKILNKDGELKPKKTRMYVVSDGAVWREIARRYLSKDSEDEDGSSNVPECPDVLKAKGYHE